MRMPRLTCLNDMRPNHRFLARIVVSAILLLSCSNGGSQSSPTPSGSQLLPKQVNPPKVGMYVTPCGPDPNSEYLVNYETALEKAKEGHINTVWAVIPWPWVETTASAYDWSRADAIILPASQQGFNVGVRLMILLTGDGTSIIAPVFPPGISHDLASASFQNSVVAFFHAFAARYGDKIKYLTIANGINNYFDKAPGQFAPFLQAYARILDTVHQAAPNVVVMPDLDFRLIYTNQNDHRQKILNPFLAANNDAIGFMCYPIDGAVYGAYSPSKIPELLDLMGQLAGGKPVYIVETAMLSKNPNTGEDWEQFQADFVDQYFTEIPPRSFLSGFAWFTLYDSKDRPDISWDIKVGCGLIRWDGTPKRAWDAWKRRSAPK